MPTNAWSLSLGHCFVAQPADCWQIFLAQSRSEIALGALETYVRLLITPGALFCLSAYVKCIELQLQVI